MQWICIRVSFAFVLSCLIDPHLRQSCFTLRRIWWKPKSQSQMLPSRALCCSSPQFKDTPLTNSRTSTLSGHEQPWSIHCSKRCLCTGRGRVVMRGGISTNMVHAWTNFQFPGCSLFTKVLDPDVMMNPPRVGETATAPVITDAPPVVIDAQDGPANTAGKCLSCKRRSRLL
jgi:hypothetical protein